MSFGEILRAADDVFISELREAGLYDAVAQAFAVLLPDDVMVADCRGVLDEALFAQHVQGGEAGDHGEVVHALRHRDGADLDLREILRLD